MACSCQEITCVQCNECAPNPCAPCEISTCLPTPPLACEDTCEIPIYTNNECYPIQRTTCVNYEGDPIPCLPIVTGDPLNTVIEKLYEYTQATIFRLFPGDESLIIVPIDDSCDDKAEIIVQVDAVTGGGDNVLELTANGLYVPPQAGGAATIEVQDTDSIDLNGDGSALDPLTADIILDGVTGGGDNIAVITAGEGLYVPPTDVADTLCDAIATVYLGDSAQFNTINQTSYDFLSTGDSGCERISPPTSFAVGGSTRKSAFGPMEWYDTLTLANAAAVSGETVLLYSDATSETLIPKTGVHYFGIGPKKILNFTSTAAIYVGNVSNIIITGDISATFTGSEITTTNVECQGEVLLDSNVQWHGGKFTSADDADQIVLQGTSSMDNIYSKISIGMNESSTLSKATVIYSGIGHVGVYLNASTNNDDSPTFTDSYVYSLNTAAVSSLAYNPTGVITVNNVTAISDGDDAAIIHGGNEDVGGSNFSSNISGKSSAGNGVLVVTNKDLLGTESLTNWAVSNINGFSTVSAGISCINANLKKCFGYSIAGNGITVGGSDNNGYNLNIIECVGESAGAYGLYATRDIFIIGGTYVSRLDSAAGNPIFLHAVPRIPPQSLNYSIVGVKTMALSALAYGIDADLAVTARISGCQFLNENVATGVLGVNHIGVGGDITYRAVTIDIYGNIT